MNYFLAHLLLILQRGRDGKSKFFVDGDDISVFVSVFHSLSRCDVGFKSHLGWKLEVLQTGKRERK